MSFVQNPLVKLLRVLKPYKDHWYEWLTSETNFLTEQEEKAMGYLIGFKGDVFSAAKLLNIPEMEYRGLIDELVNKLAVNYTIYLHWRTEQKLTEPPLTTYKAGLPGMQGL